MIIDLKKIFSTGKQSEKIECELKLDRSMGNVTLTGNTVRVSGELKSMAGDAQLNMTLVYTLTAYCDRCGGDVQMHEELSQQHILSRSLHGGEDADLYIPLHDDKLCLDELIYDDILLNLPGKILCEDDCRGLCTVCGINLNQGNCECSTERVDPRLEALKQFLG